MAKFSRTGVRPQVTAPVKSLSTTPDTVTHEGGAGFSRDAKSELFLLAVTNMVGEKTFYEDAKSRDERYERLIHQVTKEDPDWLRRFVPYLRTSMNMRSASLVMAAEYVKAGGKNGRTVVASAISRGDEPAEMLGYWISRYGKNVPKPIKRGIADAAQRLYNERNALRYDGESRGIRMADVLDLTHPDATAPWQGQLYRWVLARRHDHEFRLNEGEEFLLPRVREFERVMKLSPEEFRKEFSAELVEAAGLPWEVASSRYGKLDARFWESQIPNMGIFALVRNLRNFDEAGISPDARKIVIDKMTNPDVIAASRMFPFRFYAAAREVATTHWIDPLNTALNLAASNLPSFPGKTLVLVDASGSMAGGSIGGARSKVTRQDGSALFGALFAARAEDATLVIYDQGNEAIPVPRAAAPLFLMNELVKRFPHYGGGTATWQAVEMHLKDHDRIVIITDEQAHPGRANLGKARLYTFNVAGYERGHAASGKDNQFTFGGLSDAALVAVQLIERGQNSDWPF